MAGILSVPGLRNASADVLALIGEICERNGWNCDGFVAHIRGESGWNPAALNPTSRASGLIQWLPSTAKLYGTTAAKIRAMSVLDQLPLAEQYFVNAGQRNPLGPWDFTVAGLGTGNLPPGAMSDEQIMYAAGSPGAEGNPVLQDDTGAITVGKARAHLQGIASQFTHLPRLGGDGSAYEDPDDHIPPEPGGYPPDEPLQGEPRRSKPVLLAAAMLLPLVSLAFALAKRRPSR